MSSTPFRGARKHEAAREERFEARGNGGDHEGAARLRDAVHELHARGVQAGRVTQIGKRDERPRDLGRHVDPLGWIDANGQALDEAVELTLRQGPQDVGEPIGGFGYA